MTSKSMELRGFTPTLDFFPSFVTPVFSDKRQNYYQVIGESGLVNGFVPIEDDEESASMLTASPGVRTSTGENAIYAFAFGSNDIVYGPRSVMAIKLQPRLQDETLEAQPFTRIDVAAFVNDAGAADTAIEQATHELSKLNDSAARDWRAAIDSQYDALRREQGRHRAGTQEQQFWDKVTDFGLALVRLYRCYRRFLGVSDRRSRQTRQRDYEAAARDVFRYYLDEDFFYLIRGELKRASQIEQLAFAFSSQNESAQLLRAASLAHKGVARRQAGDVLGTIKSLKGGRAEIFDESLMVLFTPNGAMLEEAVFSRRLSAVEKKLRKRQLRGGALSLSYGVVLLLRAYQLDSNGAAKEAQSLRKLSLRALNTALSNIAPAVVRRQRPVEPNVVAEMQ